jgi:hypothetical protein
MAIPSRQIGWGTEENLLWQISKQLDYLTKVTYTASNTPHLNNVQEFADNAAAILGGLTIGDVYRTGDNLKIVH